jgi:hypothetical protein
MLSTKDGRQIQEDFKPTAAHSFTATKRGAYFSTGDEFAVFDSLGFFRFVFRMPSESGVRLLASPHAAEEPPAVHARAGDSSLKPEFSFQRTEDLTDHRPYVPGDDPRRINWKLYSHGGGLFVRDGEYEPPPHSNLMILVNTEYDPALYSLSEARHGVDLLCENALAAALACKESGMDVQIGFPLFTEGDFTGMDKKSHDLMLAWPAAQSSSAANKFPAVPSDRGILVLTMPFTGTDTALDRFIKETAGHLQIDLLFLYADSAERLAAAETCVAMYNRRPGIKTRVIGNGE